MYSNSVYMEYIDRPRIHMYTYTHTHIYIRVLSEMELVSIINCYVRVFNWLWYPKDNSLILKLLRLRLGNCGMYKDNY